MRNSRKDPEMVAAVGRLRELLVQAADAALEAIAEWEAEPRWCGVPGSDMSARSDCWYPRNYRLWGDPQSAAVTKAYDKTGGAGTRKPWRVRPEALALIGR